jgi:hypothetical protein
VSETVNSLRGEFRERSAQPRTRSVPLSHVSIELGHLYMEDFLAGPERLRAMFAEAEPWARAAMQSAGLGARRPRVSTCFLVDDYFGTLAGPDVVVPQLLAAADSAGLTIDYLARESGCARTTAAEGLVSPAELLVGRLVAEPVQGANGERPSVMTSGWLSNGERSPSAAMADAMDVPKPWTPPVQAAARRHSIFVDVELWDGEGEDRIWSCPLLAAAWQLLRLGLVRDGGEAVAQPVDPASAWPAAWSDLPTVTRLTSRAAPFCAYSSISILSPRFLPVEIAVRTILGQVWHDPEVTDQIAARAAGEKLELPTEVLDRIGYVFAGTGEVDPA